MNEENEIIDEPIEEKHIIKVRYVAKATGEINSREYTYFSEKPLAIGDLITVPVKDTFSKAKVTAINVPESEIASFKDKVKMIAPGMIVVTNIMEPVTVQEKPQPEIYDKSDALMIVEQEADTMSLQVFKVNEITTPELHQEAEKWLSVIRIKLQDAEKARMADVKKPNEYVRWINSKYKEKTDLLRRMEQHCLKAIGTFRQKERERQQLEQAKVDRAAQRRFDNQVAKGIMPVIPIPVARKVEGIAQTATTGEAKNIWGTVWDFEISNADLVPREYCVPDEKRIRQYVKLMQGKAVMPGVRFFEKDKVSVRRSKVEEPE